MGSARPLSNDRLTSNLVYPFANASFMAKNPPLCLERGDGVYVFDERGKSYLDGQGGLWNVNVGHGRPEIKQAIVDQLEKLSYYSMFGGTTTLPPVELAELMCRLAEKEGMRRVFFSSGGSEAVEAAIKLARQYWRLSGHPERFKFISLRLAYHGVTLGALSLNGRAAHREQYEPLLPGFYQVESPHLYRNPFTSDTAELGRRCADLLEREIIYQGAGSVAAFIAEPIQGAGGVVVPPPNFWPLVRQVCDRHGVLLISDEVVTGFGRSGSMFGCRAFGVAPDVMTFAKGINSGYVPLGATMINERVAQAFETEDDSEYTPRAFMHGNTYAGHPLACAAAIANLRIVEQEDLASNAKEVGAYFLDRLKEMATRHPHIGDVRGKGLMIGIELVADKESKRSFDLSERFGARIWERCVENGVLLRNVADTFIISPPLTLKKEHVDVMVDVFDQAISSVG
ncbi:putrescine aminotransferase [Bradyrhizobium sp. USDA 4524]|uniref:aminotransferase class III-fold pyridoxal phosphate-dependent enzyme n=1 Tax=unclassified Bradyrhizobium TaxID=2631580 RepID=UPI0020A04CC5|nr:MULTISPECIES: aminotransferase class III-fold pyridoxal phosphate-dependent enzyme [unclassified Bradyrhizobium]MCP1845821.1 adenosylmethionine-8-amino-7-oxononanoate aminotransferase [Bradyrhizobium sp. USDA 4538]MCP1906856.1 adenosylmethionine-8-amino-7-oxononanoate aminotransferase [Bradyrhizobium sp. USDA 4537]MCP1985331.1 adenosylmethionine-8-amino-7-oxononanoate aminotransferase [Bradyrhizobium sp. USDA 4539]